MYVRWEASPTIFGRRCLHIIRFKLTSIYYFRLFADSRYFSMNVNETVATHANMVNSRFNYSFRPISKDQINQRSTLTSNSCWFFNKLFKLKHFSQIRVSLFSGDNQSQLKSPIQIYFRRVHDLIKHTWPTYQVPKEKQSVNWL